VNEVNVVIFKITQNPLLVKIYHVTVVGNAALAFRILICYRRSLTTNEVEYTQSGERNVHGGSKKCPREMSHGPYTCFCISLRCTKTI